MTPEARTAQADHLRYAASLALARMDDLQDTHDGYGLCWRGEVVAIPVRDDGG